MQSRKFLNVAPVSTNNLKNMPAKKFLTFNNGHKMPSLGLGTVGVTQEGELETALNAALEIGYRHIDTAFAYQNETIIGKILNRWLNSGKLKREDLFITTKLPRMGVHPDRVDFFIKKSLDNLQLDYVDLYLVHFPVGAKYDERTEQMARDSNGKAIIEGKTDHAAVWKKMEEQVDGGRTKSIGVSNYTIPQLETILKSARIKPANLQIELQVYFQQRELYEFCRKNDITIVAFGPLGSRNMFERWKTPPEEIRTIPDLLADVNVKRIANKYSKTPAQVLLVFLLQLGVAPIPKSTNMGRLKENYDIFDFELDDEDVEVLKNKDRGEEGRINYFDLMKGFEFHPDYPIPRK